MVKEDKTKHNAVKSYKGRGGTTAYILNLSATWKGMVSLYRMPEKN
jgi:hypothetical protein